MKTVLGFVFLTALTSALAQTVSFRNNDLYTTVADRRVFERNGVPIVGTHIAAQLLYGSSATSLTPHTGTVTFRNVATDNSLAGTWIGGTRTLTGLAPGQTAILQVRGWDTRSGATFESALAKGISASFTYMIPSTASPPPASAFFMEGFRSFTIPTVPEPSGIGLALMGVAALLFLGRRHRRS